MAQASLTHWLPHSPDMQDSPRPTLTPAEAARTKWAGGEGILRMPLHCLGAHPLNRGGLGVSGSHAHRLAWGIKEDGVSRRRYREATVVKVPAEALASFRAFNEELCNGDELLPAFSKTMTHALLTKHHWVHALKLYGDGTHIHENTKVKIQPSSFLSQDDHWHLDFPKSNVYFI